MTDKGWPIIVHPNRENAQARALLGSERYSGLVGTLFPYDEAAIFEDGHVRLFRENRGLEPWEHCECPKCLQ